MTLGNVLPSNSLSDIGDCRNGNMIFGSKHSMADVALGVFAANFDNLRLGQSRAGMRNSPRLPALIHLIGYVVGISAKKEMVWINTRSVVAMVQNAHTFWYGAVVQFIAIAMRLYYFTINANRAVSSALLGGGPLPTIVRAVFVDFCPKTFLGCGVHTVSASKTDWLPPNHLKTLIGVWRDSCVLTAAALAKVCRNLAWGRIKGHDDLQSLCHATGRSQRRGGAFVGFVQE